MSGRTKPVRKRRTTSAVLQPTGDIAAALIAAVERDGAIARTEVAKRAARSQVLEVFDALTSAGLEVSAKFVRRPLEAQIEDVARSGPLALRGLEKSLQGATPRE